VSAEARKKEEDKGGVSIWESYIYDGNGRGTFVDSLN